VRKGRGALLVLDTTVVVIVAISRLGMVWDGWDCTLATEGEVGNAVSSRDRMCRM
jgi:hypothetical protein